jgi:hypothetical protein
MLSCNEMKVALAQTDTGHAANQLMEKGKRTMHRTNQPIARRLAVPILSVAALMLACDRDRPTEPSSSLLEGTPLGPALENVSLLTAQFYANEPLIPDGSVTQEEPLPFGNSIHVVDRDNKDGWKIDAPPGAPTDVITFEDEENCGQEPPLPRGALHLKSPLNGPATRLRSTRYHRTYLRDLSRLDYWACVVLPNRVTQWPYIVLNIDWDGDNKINDNIIFEPFYQNPAGSPTCGAGSGQNPPVEQTWQPWDALRGTPGDPTTFKACWYSSCLSDPTPECTPFPFIQSLAAYIAEHPDAAIVNLDGNHGGVHITNGVIVGGYESWVDAFTIGKDINSTSGQSLNSTITYDFQKPQSTEPSL